MQILPWEHGVSKGVTPDPFREAFQASEIQPGGFWCALCETFFTQESFRGCGLRKPAKGLEDCSEKEQRSFSCPHHLKLDFTESPSAGLRGPHPRLLSFHEERPHLCFLHCLTFLCAVPRMDKVHSPNFLQGRCGPTRPAPEVPFFSKRKEPKIRQRGSVLFGIFS